MAIPAQQKPYYFISYSRQEVTFVDSFARELEKRGLYTWVDFRNLVPGQPWQNQLDDGVNNAKTILLVVSKASMASLPVKDEWTKSLAKGKRIILILFEPCKLDPGLTGLEWVDFTKPFDKAMSKLIGLLARSTQLTPSTPSQKWMYLPAAVMVFAFLSLLLVYLCGYNILVFGALLLLGIYIPQVPFTPPVMLFSAVAALSVFYIWLPAIINFAWLPIQLFRRTHNAQKIRNTLNALLYTSLLLIILSVIIYFLGNTADSSTPAVFDQRSLLNLCGLCFIMIGMCVYLNRLLVSKAMYRWSGPNGVLVQSRPPNLTGHIDTGVHMRVAVEYAPQDRRYAQELKASIGKAGHFYTDHVHSADIVLSLLSVYKTDSEFDLEKIRMIPILLQVCQVDQRLSRMQWIDLRHGKVSMDAVAHLLDEPAELLRTLGVLPVRQIILPNAVKWLSILISFFLTMLLVTTLLWAFMTLLLDPFGLHPSTVNKDLILPASAILGLYFLRRYILNRKLRYLPFLSYWWAVGFAILVFPLAVRSIILDFPLGGIDEFYGWAAPLYLLSLSMLHKDVRLWLPSHVKSGKKTKTK